MSQFAYSFCISMLHSFWQCALLWLFYAVFTHLLKNQSPLTKRNLLFGSTCLALIVFIVTFFIYYFRVDNSNIPFSFSIIEYLPTKNSLLLLTNLFFTIYCLLLFYRSVSTLVTFLHFKKTYTATLQKPSLDLRLFTTQKAFHLGIKRKVTVWYSNTVTTPLTFGFLKPIILLPISLVNNISIQQTETLLLHELAHIKANDYLINWVVVCIETFFFFNPFIAALCKQLKLQRELNCDNTVITHNYSPVLYAETLFVAAQQNKAPARFSLAAITTKKQLLKRILFFTTTKASYTTKNYKGALLLFFVAYAFVFLLFVQTALPGKVNTPSTKDLLLFPILGVETDLTFTTEPVPNNSIERTSSSKKQSAILLPKQNNIAVKNNSEKAIDEITNEVNLIPINFSEEELVKQVIIEEEQSGNKPAALMVYSMVYEEGNWVLKPQWMVSKTKTTTTNKGFRDSTQPLNKQENMQ